MKWPIFDKGELAEPPQLGPVKHLSKSVKDVQPENLNPDVAEFVPHDTVNGNSGKFFSLFLNFGKLVTQIKNKLIEKKIEVS